ncbi:MAG: hypothetical protein RL026_2252 [Pseudomonadota bacterium]|jgi:phosphatidylglycerophosphatase C
MTAKGIALFDLDGTVARRDTFGPYMLAALRCRPWRVFRLAFVLPCALGFVAGRVDRGGLKSAVVRAVLGGWTREAVQRLTADYVAARLSALAFPAALSAIERHRAAGDRLVLLSASPDLYVPSLGKALGFDEVICTGLTWDGGRLEGRLATANRRGEEKRRCLDALRERFPGLPVTAYGNAGSDLAHLLACERGCYINPRRRERRHLASLGLDLLDWR